MKKSIDGKIMEMTAVGSKNIAYVGFEDNAMGIEFNRGPVYVYRAVPQAVYDAFLASEEPDVFFDASIKNAYANKRVW